MNNYDKEYRHKALNPLAFAVDTEPNTYLWYCLSADFAGYVRQFLSRMGDNPYWFYSASLQGDRYRTPSREVFDVVQGVIAEGVNELMSGCDVVPALEKIEDAIRSQSLNCAVYNTGSQYAGPITPPPSEFQDDGSTFPPQYPDRPSFTDGKCNWATKIVDDIYSDMYWLSTADVVALGVLGFAAGLLTPIFGDEILFAFAVITTSLTIGEIFYSQLLEVLDQERDTLICTLFESTDVQDAKGSYLQVITNSSYWPNGTFISSAIQLLGFWLNWGNVNRLFEEGDTSGVVGNCSGCESTGCVEQRIEWGTVLDSGIGFIRIASQYDPTPGNERHTVYVEFNNNGAEYCGNEVKDVSAEVVSGTVVTAYPPNYANPYRMFRQSGVAVYDGASPPSDIDQVGYLAFISRPANGGTEFTVDIFYRD